MIEGNRGKDLPFLKGIRVIALTWVWAGPWMGAVLADMGAEVIKIVTTSELPEYWKIPGRNLVRSRI
jgi:crotonobetainyl-CoA:carnitine CoA-transferase CaiB-like acyl-CoA transferase